MDPSVMERLPLVPASFDLGRFQLVCVNLCTDKLAVAGRGAERLLKPGGEFYFRRCLRPRGRRYRIARSRGDPVAYAISLSGALLLERTSGRAGRRAASPDPRRGERPAAGESPIPAPDARATGPLRFFLPPTPPACSAIDGARRSLRRQRARRDFNQAEFVRPPLTSFPFGQAPTASRRAGCSPSAATTVPDAGRKAATPPHFQFNRQPSIGHNPTRVGLFPRLRVSPSFYTLPDAGCLFCSPERAGASLRNLASCC